MKLALLAIVLASLLVGCGSDGNAGDAFVAVDWVGTPFYFNDTNPAIPTMVYRGTYYAAVAGTFTFLYEAWDQSVWSGAYTISVNPGEDGGFFPWDDGGDGEDNYFTLWLLSSGPVVEASSLSLDVEEERARVTAETLLKRNAIEKTQWPGHVDYSGSNPLHVVQEVSTGRYHIKLESFCLKPSVSPADP